MILASCGAIILPLLLFRNNLIYKYQIKANHKCHDVVLGLLDIIKHININYNGVSKGKLKSALNSINSIRDNIFNKYCNYDKQFLKIHLWTYKSLYGEYEKALKQAGEAILTDLE